MGNISTDNLGATGEQHPIQARPRTMGIGISVLVIAFLASTPRASCLARTRRRRPPKHSDSRPAGHGSWVAC